MTIGKRILLAIPIGWMIAVGAILIPLLTGNETVRRIFLWNVLAVSALAGDGPILGYDAQGEPIYEGTPVLILFELIGLLSSFVIYPISVFLILTAYNKFYSSRENFTEEHF